MRRNVLKISIAGALSVALVFATAALAETIRGTQGDNNITGTEGPDKVVAKKGNDTINSLGGDDRVGAGRGADTVNAGLGNDRVWGGSDIDDLNGELGNDALNGKRGADDLDGGEGNDFLNGGQGRDNVIGGPGDDFVKAWGDGNRADNIDCGDGLNDTAIVDRNDTTTNCEHVETRAGNSKGPKGPKP
jgi:Ca2+-binding RTX toxin-like protein